VGELGLSASVDQIVVAKSRSTTSVPWALLVASGLLAAVGIVLLDRAATKRRARGAETAPAQPGPAGVDGSRSSAGKTPMA
jgi:hypothetical protein